MGVAVVGPAVRADDAAAVDRDGVYDAGAGGVRVVVFGGVDAGRGGVCVVAAGRRVWGGEQGA